MPFGVLDFIDAASVDLAERPMFQAPGDDMLDRVENLVPGCAKASAVSFYDSRRAQPARKSM